MKAEVRGECSASAKKIWDTCFLDLRTWSKWDPDIVEVQTKEGDHFCSEGATCEFIMKEPKDKRHTVTLTNVIRNRELTFGGSLILGMVTFKGHIILSEDEIPGKTSIHYSFGLTGLVGGIMGRIMSKPIQEGCEKGLANICSLAEDKGILHE